MIYVILAFMFVWSFALINFNGSGDTGVMNQIIVFTAYSLFMGLAFAYICGDIYVFFRCLSWTCFIQAIFVYFSFLTPEYRVWQQEILVQGGNIPFTTANRVAGFSNSSGASLSLALALGVFSSMFMYATSKSGIRRLFYLSLALTTTLSCIFVGKTGLFLSVYFIVGVCLVTILWEPVRLVDFLVLCCVILGFSIIFFVLKGSEGYLASAIRRSFAMFGAKGDATVDVLISMGVPNLDLNSLLGAGVTLSPLGGNASGSDVGYIQSYYAYGLLASAVFYISVFIYFLKNILLIKNNKNKALFLVLFIPLFIVELKEPFIFKVSYCFVLFAATYLVEKRKLLTVNQRLA